MNGHDKLQLMHGRCRPHHIHIAIVPLMHTIFLCDFSNYCNVTNYHIYYVTKRFFFYLRSHGDHRWGTGSHELFQVAMVAVAVAAAVGVAVAVVVVGQTGHVLQLSGFQPVGELLVAAVAAHELFEVSMVAVAVAVAVVVAVAVAVAVAVVVVVGQTEIMHVVGQQY